MNIRPAEIIGGLAEEHTPDGVRVWRRFVVPWEKRTKFVDTLFVSDHADAPAEPADPPGTLPLRPVSVRFRDIGRQAARAAPASLPLPPQTLLDAEVEYIRNFTLPPADGTTLPASLVMLPIEGCDIPREAISLTVVEEHEGGESALSANQGFERVLPTGRWLLVAESLVDPPAVFLGQLKGKVNAREFLGFPAETLFVAAAVARPIFRVHDAPCGRWELRLQLWERWWQEGTEQIGWNHLFRPATGKWERILIDNRPLYPTADFDLILDIAL